ncbi:MAG: glycosyltransferase family 2 protein [Candidatus ainarchaeum sp.]|nr:glycosyltransferase family 2 protein [Candidatus ainarchaeum sp.]
MIKEKYLVSVVMPTHNRGKVIRRSIDSIINQSYENWELIIVDDGSIDNTNLIVSNYIKAYPEKIKYYFYKENKGASYARNIGIKKSRGSFLTFLDSDDEFCTDKISLQLQAMIHFNKSFSLTDCEIYIDNKKKQKSMNVNGPKILKPIDVIFNKGSLISVMIRRDIINDAKYFNENLPSSNDYDFVLKYVSSYDILYLPNFLLKVHKSLDLKSDRISTNYSKKIKGYSELLVMALKNEYNFSDKDNHSFIIKLNGDLGIFKLLNNEFVEGRKHLKYYLNNSIFSIKKIYAFILLILSYNKHLFNFSVVLAKALWRRGILST